MTAPFWDLLSAEIGKYDETTRKQLGLHPDSAFFWSFIHDEIEIVGNTEARLTVLKALRRDCDFFGNFTEPHMAPVLRNEYGIRMCETLDCLSELPTLYRTSELMIDVINAGYISGTSPKVTSCFACGGMMLFDYKDDFRQAMGDIADMVMYTSIDHLHALIELYLGHPHKRREVSLHLQQRVLREFTFGAFAKRVLITERAWRN